MIILFLSVTLQATFANNLIVNQNKRGRVCSTLDQRTNGKMWVLPWITNLPPKSHTSTKEYILYNDYIFVILQHIPPITIPISWQILQAQPCMLKKRNEWGPNIKGRKEGTCVYIIFVIFLLERATHSSTSPCTHICVV